MLKHKLKIITLVMILIFSLIVPVVRAENEEAINQSTVSEEKNTSTEDPENTDFDEESDSHSHAENSSAEDMKKEDVYLIGDSITIDYVVDGNLFVIANSVTINSQVGGDAFICANKINIEKDGYIFSNLFALSNELNISGVVYDLYTASKNVNLNGYIYRDIHVSSDSFYLSGTIGRNANISVNNFTFPTRDNKDSEDYEMFSSDSGIIYGDLNYGAPEEISIPDGLVTGKINYNKSDLGTSTNTIQDYIWDLGTFVVTVIVIWLLTLWLAPKFLEKTDYLISKKFWPSLGLGVLTTAAIIVAAIILLILGLTAEIAFLSIGLLALLLFIGVPIFTISINRFICKKLKIEKNIITFGILIISSIIIWLTTLIPFAGGIINLIIKIIGLGIIVKYIFTNKKNNKSNIENVEKTE